MAWSAPMTAIPNTAFSDVEYNKYIRNNLLETAPAKATASGEVFITTGVHAIKAVSFKEHEVATSQNATSTSYTNLATIGPTITVTTGTSAICWWSVNMSNNTLNEASSAAVAVTGSSNWAAHDRWRATTDGRTASNGSRISSFHRFGAGTLKSGSNTFTVKYKVSGVSTGTFSDRTLIVLPL